MVNAYYYTAEEGTAVSEDYDTVETNKNYTVRSVPENSDTSEFGFYYTTEYDGTTDGTYPVYITFGGNKLYNSREIASYDITVYPVYKIELIMTYSKYPINHTLTNRDYSVKATYGTADKTVDTRYVTKFCEITSEPNMSTVGGKTLTVMYNGDENLTASAAFTVYDPDNLIVVKDDSAYVDDTENNYITNIQPNTTVATLKDNLENDATTIQVVGKDDNAKLATGDVVQLVIDGTPLDERTIVVLGDVNGDAKVNSRDAKRILDRVVGLISLDEAYEYACDTNGDNAIKSRDAKKVLDFAVGLVTEF